MYFHYTSIEAILGIVTSQSVWMSSLAFMNDEMEGFELYDVLREYLGLQENTHTNNSQLDLVKTSVEAILRWQLCFSASTLKDDISQWRGYTPIGLGACIEFNDGFLPTENLKQISCIYDRDEKKNHLKNYATLSKSGDNLNQILSEQLGIQSFVEELADALARFKHQSFRPEQEIRWILSLRGLNDPRAKLSYRPHRLGLVSYIPITVDLSKVCSITLGPQVPAQNLKTVEDLLIQYDCAGYVTKSSVSLR